MYWSRNVAARYDTSGTPDLHGIAGEGHEYGNNKAPIQDVPDIAPQGGLPALSIAALHVKAVKHRPNERDPSACHSRIGGLIPSAVPVL